MTVNIGKNSWLRLQDVYKVANMHEKVQLPENVRKKIKKSRDVLLKFVDDRLPIYGVSTQFGDDANRVHVEGDYEEYLDSLVRRQRQVIRALNCGMGEICSNEIIRATMFLRAQAHAQCASGIRPELTDAMLALINNDVLPIIKRHGSVGASGDLVPHSAIALALMGEGSMKLKGKFVPSKQALKEIGLEPLILQMKEGLSIVNGTSFSTATAALAIHKLCYLLPLSITAIAICTEAMLAMDSGYQPFVHASKHHPGQIDVAKFVRDCWKGSKLIRSLDALRLQWRDDILKSGKAEQEHVQDYYSLRSIAHGFGPFAENLKRAIKTIEEEMNSANDNPVIDIDENQIHHGANFLTDYVAVVGDHLRADVAKASTWMHAILSNLVHPRKNRGLPSNLVPDPEEHTGYKTIQLMVASITIHNRSRTIPVSSVMIPTEGDNQDMISLGPQSAFDLMEVVENYARITAALLMAGAQAIEIRGVNKASDTAKKIHTYVRKHSSFLEIDRPMSGDLEMIAKDIQCNPEIIEPWFLTDGLDKTKNIEKVEMSA